MITKIENTLVSIPQKRFAYISVLIVAEKYISGKTLQSLLEKQNFCVTGVCTSVTDALEQVRRNKSSFVITDMMLRDSGDIHFVEQLNFQKQKSNLRIFPQTLQTIWLYNKFYQWLTSLITAPTTIVDPSFRTMN